jgi:hypothetical protein
MMSRGFVLMEKKERILGQLTPSEHLDDRTQLLFFVS